MENSTEYIQDIGSEPKSAGLDIKLILLRVLSIWPIILACLVISLVIAYYNLRSTEPVYQARSIVMIKDPAKGGAGSIDNTVMQQLGVGGNGVRLENETEILKSYDLMWQVVSENQLYLTVKHQGRISEHTLYGNDLPYVWEFANPDTIRGTMRWIMSRPEKRWLLQARSNERPFAIDWGKWYEINGLKFRLWPNVNLNQAAVDSKIWDSFENILVPISSATGQYQNSFNIRQMNEQSAVLLLYMLDKHPQKAKDALNAVINGYNHMGLNDKNQVTENIMEFLSSRLDVVEGELRSVEAEVANFKTENKITDISANAQQYLTDVNNMDLQKSVEQSKLNMLDALEHDLVINKNNPQMFPSTWGIAEPTLGNLISIHNDLILQNERMKEKAGPANPLLVDLQNQIRDVRASMIENIKNLRQSYEVTLRDIEQKNSILNGRLRSMPQLERDLVQITRDKSVKEQLYLFLLQKREEAAVTLASNIGDSRSIEKARPMGQVSPNAQSIWTMAWTIGFFLPIGVLLGLDFLNNKVGSAKEVEAKTHVPLLGEINFVKHLESPIPILTSVRSVIAEQIRSIRTAIGYTGKGKAVKSILVASHRPGEGKSFTCLNLAASYAMLDKKVVVLEFDLRKPRLSKNLGLSPKAGISNYLSSNVELDDLLMKVPQGNNDNFYLLPCGPIPPNPAELILNEKMTVLMKALAERFDYIILDTPPFSLVTDATLLQRHVDISIVVLRQGFSLKTVYNDLDQRMIQYPDMPIYTVLNGVGRSEKYSPYGYSYGYGYGYGYGYANYYDDDSSN